MTARATFAWLMTGAMLFAALLAILFWPRASDTDLSVTGLPLGLTAIFGLPLVVRSWHLDDRWRRAAYFLIALYPVHYAAQYVALSINVGIHMPNLFLNGAVGGAVGAILSFGLLALLRLTKLTPRSLTVAAAGTILLALVGSASFWAADILGAFKDNDPSEPIEFLMLIYPPWQIVFASVLGMLMARSPAA